MKYWEIIADKLSKAGWSWGCVSAIDSQRRTIWIDDAHHDEKRFVVRRNEKLTAFLELASACAKTEAEGVKNEPEQPKSVLRTLSLVVPTIHKFRA
jgi:hypothetical protein